MISPRGKSRIITHHYVSRVDKICTLISNPSQFIRWGVVVHWIWGGEKGGGVNHKNESKNIFFLSGLLSNINGAACVTDGLTTEHKMLETDRTARGKMLVIDMFIQIQGVH